MYAAERHESILERARAQGRVDVGGLAESLGVTVETVRRDLTALERLGVVRRVHGGAIPVERLTLEPTLATKVSQRSEQKRRIAARAVEEIPDGGSILLDSGTTTLAIADFLPSDKALTVVTNSFAVATQLADTEGIELMMLGGLIRTRTGAAVGQWTIEALKDMHVDVAFLGTNGFSVARGFTTPDQAEAATKRAMVGASRRVVVVADARKAGQVHLHRFADTEEVAMLLTDSSLDDETAEDFDAAGVEVVRT